MPELAALTARKPTPLTLRMGDETLNLVFDRNLITPSWDDAMRQDPSPFSVARALAEVIVEWDVVQNGEPFPPTMENLSVLSYEMQAALMREVQLASVPGADEGNASSSTSSIPSTGSVPPPVIPQNGQPLSSSPQPSASPLLT